jgi:hypothetical protein
MIPENATSSDSISIVRTFVRNWVEQQVVLDKALQNLTPEELDFSDQLKEYRNSLIIFKYESKLVLEYLDTVVTDDQIRSYYEEFKDSFILKEHILKVNYVIIGEDYPEINHFQRLIMADDEEKAEELAKLCSEYNADCYLDDRWFYFSDILGRFPLNVDDPVTFLSRNRNVRVKEDGTWYLMKIKDFRLAGEVSPLELETENIKKIILNKRKLDLKKKIRIDLIDGAVENSEVEFY